MVEIHTVMLIGQISYPYMVQAFPRYPCREVEHTVPYTLFAENPLRV